MSAVDCVRAAAAVDPDLGLARLWDGGGMQVATDDGLVLAVVRSTYVDESDAAEDLCGVHVAPGSWLTEAYAPHGEPLSDAVADALAALVDGALVRDPLHLPGGAA